MEGTSAAAARPFDIQLAVITAQTQLCEVKSSGPLSMTAVYGACPLSNFGDGHEFSCDWVAERVLARTAQCLGLPSSGRDTEDGRCG